MKKFIITVAIVLVTFVGALYLVGKNETLNNELINLVFGKGYTVSPNAELKIPNLPLAEITQKAERGDPVMQYHLGQIYQAGHGVQKDEATATAWFLKSAQQGLTQANTQVGIRYLTGLGLPKNRELGLKFLETAALQGYGVGQMVLAAFYLGELGNQQIDQQKGFEWMLKAAENNIAQAQYQVGDMYTTGVGTNTDDKQAIYWYQKAANNGHEAAQNKLRMLNK